MATPVTIIFREPDGHEISVQAEPGQSVMEAAVMQGVPGIEGECGGCLSCATCHVFAPEGLDEPSPEEDAMLDFTEVPRGPTSRLSCQIKVGPELEGKIFLIPGEA